MQHSVAQVCRFCLMDGKDDAALTVLTGNRELMERVLIATTVQISYLPNHSSEYLCTECVKMVNLFFTFRSQCMVNASIHRKKLSSLAGNINVCCLCLQECAEGQLVSQEDNRIAMVGLAERPALLDRIHIVTSLTMQVDSCVCTACETTVNRCVEFRTQCILREKENSHRDAVTPSPSLHIKTEPIAACDEYSNVGVPITLGNETPSLGYEDRNSGIHEGIFCTPALVKSERSTIELVPSMEIFEESTSPLLEFPGGNIRIKKKYRKRKPTLKQVYMCTVCDKQYPKEYQFKCHMRTHTGERPFGCNVCDKHFYTRATLKVHLRTHTGEKPYECSICKRRFAEQSSLNKHVKTHTGARPHQCNICQQYFAEISGLNRHAQVHSGEKPYDCDICTKKFTRWETLNRHMKIHTGEKPYQCDVCLRRFSESVNLRNHYKCHTGDKAHECSICKKRFTVLGSLRAHYLSHSGEKLFECEICNKTFTQPGYLKIHAKLHGTEQLFECDVCQKRFPLSCYLRRHQKIHTDSDQRYECQFCKAQFKQERSLNRHLQMHVCDDVTVKEELALEPS